MPRMTLTPSRIAALKPRASAYDIRDGKLPGFGVRIMPSGAKHYFIHSQNRGKRVWQTVGDANALDVDEALSRATAMQAALRRGAETPSPDGDALFETAARTAFRRHERLWKAGTFDVNSSYLDNQILPRFRGCRIDHADVGRWFASRDASGSRPFPAGSLRRHARGGTHGPSPGRIQPLPRHPAKPPQGTRTVPYPKSGAGA